jgi:tripartite-type tricarboxylate transporter receptor subunit TctC
MQSFKKQLILIVILSTVAIGNLFFFSIASAVDTYPIKPIKIFVPYEPGGATDIAARVLANNLPSFLEQPLVIFNKPGAGGSICFDYLRNAKADGYSIMMVANGANCIYPAMNPNLPFKWDDIKYIARTQILPDLLIVKNNNPWKNFKAFADALKKNPGKYTYATAGVGTSSHLGGAVILKELGLPLSSAKAIHYNSDAAALLALIQGKVDFMQSHLSVAGNKLKKKVVRGLMMTTAKRIEGWDIPTCVELGYPGIEFVGWRGVAAPAGISDEIVQIWEASIEKMTKSKGWVKTITKLGDEPAYMNSKDFTQFQAEKFKMFQELFEELGLIKN